MAVVAPRSPARALTIQFLEWLSSGVRTHADVMDVWRSSCPRLTIWEDALADGLVRFEESPTRRIVPTRLGLALLIDETRVEQDAAA